MSKYINTIKELIENSNKQMSLKEITIKTGIPKATVHRVLKKLNYKCIREEVWNKGLTKENNASIMSASKKLKQRTGWHHDEKTKYKISRSQLENPIGDSVYEYGDDIIRSDYELEIAKLLDDEYIKWNNDNSIFEYVENGITRALYMGLYVEKYNIYLNVKYCISNKERRLINLAAAQNNIKILIVDQMIFRRMTCNNIKDILKNSLQNK